MPNAAAVAETHNYCNISSFVIVKWEAGAYLEIMGYLEFFSLTSSSPRMLLLAEIWLDSTKDTPCKPKHWGTCFSGNIIAIQKFLGLIQRYALKDSLGTQMAYPWVSGDFVSSGASTQLKWKLQGRNFRLLSE